MRSREQNRLYQQEWRARNRGELRVYQRAWASEWRKKNPEKMRVNARRYWEQHRDKCAAPCRAWYKKNREQSMSRSRSWQKAHPEKVRTWSRCYHDDHPSANAQRSLAWRKSHPHSSTEYNRKRRVRDPIYWLITNVRARINQALKRDVKLGRTVDLLGCSIRFYKTYLSSLFLPGMSWETRNFDIDHIEEICAFDLMMLAGQRAAFNYRNTRPLFKADHVQRHSRRPVRYE